MTGCLAGRGEFRVARPPRLAGGLQRHLVRPGVRDRRVRFDRPALGRIALLLADAVRDVAIVTVLTLPVAVLPEDRIEVESLFALVKVGLADFRNVDFELDCHNGVCVGCLVVG